MRRAVGEAVAVVAAALGFGGELADERAYRPRRGAAHVAIQVGAVAVLVVLLILARIALGAPPAAPLGWAIAGGLMLLPFALQWFAAPPRRGTGLLAGLAVVAAVFLAAWPLLTDAAFWPGFVVVVVACVAGGAAFGAVAPVPGRTDG